MEIGVGPGIRITLNADNEPQCRGARVEDALPCAERKLRVATGEQRDFLRQWVKAARKQIGIDQLEARVDKEYKKEYEPREKYGAKLPALVREGVKEDIRNEIRKKLKPE
jgi:urocanate hydratase